MPDETAPSDRIDSSFPHSWQARVLERRPLIVPSRQFVYPALVEEVERGALEVLVRPASGREFLATFALGFADPAVPTGVWACPNPDWLCAVAGGYAYLVNTTDPRDWKQVPYRPVLTITALPEKQLLLFGGHHSLLAYGPNGEAWETGRLSWEGFKILTVGEDHLTGLGWDLMTDQEYEFRVELSSGEHLRLQ